LQILEKQQHFFTAQKNSESIYRAQKEMEAEHEEKINGNLTFLIFIQMFLVLPTVEAQQVDEKDPEMVLEKKLTDCQVRVRALQEELKTMNDRLKEAQRQCDLYRAKIGDFEAIESMATKHVEALNEIHSLQKVHQQTEKELWHVQKVSNNFLEIQRSPL
jgi:uncharacterized protein YlxW (UPF0749 family)